MGSMGEDGQHAGAAEWDVLCIGGGLSGIYSLYRMRELGFRGKLLERGSAEGGTWVRSRPESLQRTTQRLMKLSTGNSTGTDSTTGFLSSILTLSNADRNFSPGARFDSESYSYQYFFDQDLMNEWHWEEHFAGQPEILRYINHVVERYDLKKDMQFDVTIEKARFDANNRIWVLTDQHGEHYTCRWLITALGILTNPTLPNIPGIKDFKGEACHTARWPKTPVNFENKVSRRMQDHHHVPDNV